MRKGEESKKVTFICVLDNTSIFQPIISSINTIFILLKRNDKLICIFHFTPGGKKLILKILIKGKRIEEKKGKKGKKGRKGRKGRKGKKGKKGKREKGGKREKINKG